MRVALMTNNYKPTLGGVPISVECLKEGLLSLGVEVTVFAPACKEQEEEENVFRYASLLQNSIGGLPLPNPMDRRIEEAFRKKRYDVIHVQHPMLIGRTAVYLSKKYHIPLVFTYHTRYEQYLCYFKSVKALEQRAGQGSRAADSLLHTLRYKLLPLYLNCFMKHCELILTPTAGMRTYLNRVCGIPWERMELLPTGIDKRHFETSKEQTRLLREKYQAENIPLLLSVARMAPEKNIVFLLHAISTFKQYYRKPFRLLMVGDGPGLAEYRELCRQLALEEEVIFTGKVDHAAIASYYAAADVFVFASKTETQGIVILEALAKGTPVCAVRASGVEDIVEDGFNGCLTPEDTASFAQSLLRLLEQGRENAMLSTFSRNAEKTADHYREEAVAAKAVHLYNRVIEKYTSTAERKFEGSYGRQISHFGSGG
ncbi:MAG: glycosyltransferase [Roseburia sp.]|nr:glycosyltransferase [Roseburia sp.]